jgi:catechol 2,3-dioxygenase-like lactoylglutathione lyase family enzyme
MSQNNRANKEAHMPDSDPRPPTFFGGVTPILRVENLAKSIDYYTRVLGFKYNWGDEFFASVSRDECNLFLCPGDQGLGCAWVWIGVGDADAVFEELQANGAKIRHPLTNYRWAWEMQVEDLDGNVLRIGSGPRDDRPWGYWFDMYGRHWGKGPDGRPMQISDISS